MRYIVIFNNGSPTEPNGVSESSLVAAWCHIESQCLLLSTLRLKLKSLERSQGWG
jgi:hypothetical protein